MKKIQKFLKIFSFSLMVTVGVNNTIIPTSSIITMAAEKNNADFQGIFLKKIPSVFNTSIEKPKISLDTGYSVQFLPEKIVTYPEADEDDENLEPIINYPDGYICKAFSFVTDSSNSFYKIHIGNISISNDMFCSIYDSYGENIGTEDDGEITVPMSQSVDPVIKLQPNKQYYIVLSVENSETLLDESIGRISVSKIDDDVEDTSKKATSISFKELNEYNLQGHNDNDYFSFKTKKSDAFYQFYAYNENISNRIIFEILTNQNEVIASYQLENKETISDILKLSNDMTYYVRVYASTSDDIYSTAMIGDYNFKIEAIDDDWPDLNAIAPMIKTDVTYQGKIQYSEDKDIMKFNSGDMHTFTLQIANYSTTDKIEYKVQTYEKENIISDVIEAGHIKNISLGDNTIDSTLKKNTDYYIVFSGNEGIKYSFNVIPKKHCVHYVLNGGINDIKNPISFNESANITLYKPVKDNYTFNGWYTTKDFVLEKEEDDDEVPKSSLLDNLGKYSEDVTLYAKWTPTDYHILYFLSGGVNAEENPITATVEDTFVLENPTKTGYMFAGWYTSPTYEEDTKITEINKLTSNIQLCAKWTKITSATPSIKKLTQKTKSATVSWKKINGVKGYEVRYSQKSSMSSAKIIKTTASKTSVKITNLTKKKKYYIQIRSYKKDSNGLKVYSKWSSKKSVKIK